MQRLLDKHPGVSLLQLGVGEGVLAKRPTAVSTVLGSCVAVTFHCPVLRIGAVFHALMPTMNSSNGYSECIGEYKFVDDAIRRFAASMYRRGVKRGDMVCKVFGGANAMFAESFGVGRKNVLTAFETLEGERLRVVASDVGGERGRKMLFMTHTGEVFIKRLRAQQSNGCSTPRK